MVIEIIKAWIPFAIVVAIWGAAFAYAAKKRRLLPELPVKLLGPDDALTIGRVKNSAGILRNFTVLVDGENVGRVGPGEIKHFSVAPGAHSVAVKIDWCKSEPIAVQKREGENIALRCGIRFDDWRCMYIAFTRPKEFAYVANDG